VTQKDSAEKAVRDIRRKFSAEEKIRIVVEGLRATTASLRSAVAKGKVPATRGIRRVPGVERT
jgi:transposase-like protein